MCMIIQFSSIVLLPNLANYFDVWRFAGIVQRGRGSHEGEMGSDSQQHLDPSPCSEERRLRLRRDVAMMRQHPRVGWSVG